MEIERIENENFIGIIHRDEHAESPRDWDNLGTMICHHRRYNLGDKHKLDFSNCSSWKDNEAVIRKEYGKDCIMLPLYLYDHSGITMNTTGFSCNWDSGRVGTIVVSREKARKELQKKVITEKVKNQILEYLKGEVETYDKYLTGEVYGYTITDKDGEELDSCWGYYGLDDIRNEVTATVRWHNQDYNKVHGIQTELELV